MTEAKKKSSRMRRQRDGRVTVGFGGRVIVDFEDFIDTGESPERYVSGLARAVMIDPGVARFTFYSQRPDNQGGMERSAVFHMVCSVGAMSNLIEDLTRAIEAIQSGARPPAQAAARSDPVIKWPN